MYRSYLLRLKPTNRQRKALTGILGLSCDLYNASLQERRDAWNIRREIIKYNHQQRELTEIRADDPDVRAVAVEIAREPLRRVDRAFKAFFRRCRSGEKPGYPRFRARARYSNLAKSILDAAWGELIWQLMYKAEHAGTWAIPVNPRNTTINCSACGEKVPKTLAQRIHFCPFCGLVLDRDHNAAINIRNLALGTSAVGASLQNISG